MGYSPWGRKESDVTDLLHFRSIPHPHHMEVRYEQSLSVFGLLDNLINKNKIEIINHGGVGTPNWHQFSSVAQSCPTL